MEVRFNIRRPRGVGVLWESCSTFLETQRVRQLPAHSRPSTMDELNISLNTARSEGDAMQCEKPQPPATAGPPNNQPYAQQADTLTTPSHNHKNGNLLCAHARWWWTWGSVAAVELWAMDSETKINPCWRCALIVLFGVRALNQLRQDMVSNSLFYFCGVFINRESER